MSRIADPRLSHYGVALEAMARIAKELDRSLRDRAGLSLPWFEALLRVERSGGSMTMGALAQQIVLTSGGVTRLVDRLVGEGYAERRACEEDRRVQYVVITDAGRAVLEDALGIHLDDLQGSFFDHMSDEERDTVVRVMRRIRAAERPACGGA